MIIVDKILNTEKKYLYLILLFFGLFISYNIKYGDDIDSHSLILSYLNIIEKGIYNPSRFYGSPLAEILIGFFSYNFGGFFSSFLCYLLYLISIISLFNYTNHNKVFKKTDLNLFIILAVSNPVLVFDNSNPSDFILALFFFSTGISMLKSRLYLFSSIFLAFSIACRANFAFFVYVILFYQLLLDQEKKIKNIIFVTINTTIIGALFYLPVFIINKFSFTFITNSGGPSIVINELLPRFIYKIYLSVGIYSSLLFFIFLFFLNFELIKKIFIEFKKEILIILVNLLVFYLIPTKTAIISLSILLIYLIILRFLKKKFIFLIIFLNIMYWIVGYKLIDINYKNTDQCHGIQALSTNFNIELEKGFFFTKIEKIKIKMNCDSKFFKNKQNFLKGKKLSSNNAIRH